MTIEKDARADDYREDVVLSIWWRKPLFITGLLLLLITGIVTMSVYLAKSLKSEKGRIAVSPVKEGASPPRDGALWMHQTKSVTEGSLRIEATYLTDALLKTLPVSAWLTEDEMRIYGFYLISITTENDCISDDFALSPSNHVSVIDKNGKDIPVKVLPVLNNLQKVIYKPYVCGKDKGIVFLRFFIAFPKSESPVGAVVDGVKIVFEKKS